MHDAVASIWHVARGGHWIVQSPSHRNEQVSAGLHWQSEGHTLLVGPASPEEEDDEPEEDEEEDVVDDVDDEAASVTMPPSSVAGGTIVQSCEHATAKTVNAAAAKRIGPIV